MNQTDLLHAALAQEGAYLDTLQGLVRLESPTPDKVAADRLADHLQALLAEDWAIERLAQAEAGDQLVARQNAPGDTSTLLLCHYDTVWPLGTLERMPLRRDGDKYYGPGILDMKAGIATALHAARLAREAGGLRGPLTLLLSSDEETGSRVSRDLIEELARQHDRVLVLEPGRDDGALKTGRKGVGDFHIRFEGKSAHAGNNPKEGASALRELAHFLLYAEDLASDEAATSVNLTTAKGGSAGNVIAEEAIAGLDVRVLQSSEAERVEESFRCYAPRDPRVKVTVGGGLNRPPMEPNAANRALAAEARQLAGKMGLTLEEAVVGGGSDGNFTSALGVPTLDGLGAVGEGPHARHEHIRVRETLERLALVAALLARS
ncbi:MAG TPA: M20 family metallopeptidase [Trueperaceae bacterium]